MSKANPLAALSRVASSAAKGVARSASSVAGKSAALAKRGASSAMTAAPVAAKKVTKYVWNATREPLASAAKREGVSLAGHGGAYTLDSIFSWRAWGGWLRPSFFFTLGNFVLSGLLSGKWSVVFRNAGQGGLHHLFARSLDKVHDMLAPGSPSGTAGAEESVSRDAGSSSY